MNIEFSPTEAKEFKKRYKDATDNNRSSFVFNNNVFFTTYAKYVVEYLDTLMTTLN